MSSPRVRSFRKKLETPLMRLALAVLPLLPRGGLLALANAAGQLAYYGSGKLRRVGMANLKIAYPSDKDSALREKILKKAFQHFALLALDTIWFSRDTEKRIRQWVRFAPSTEAVMKPGAQICITAHIGNWEVLGMAMALHGYPLASVAAPLKNEEVDKLFNGIRSITGQQIIPRRGALRGLIRTLREGRKIALLLDQNTQPHEGGVFVNFFGLPTPISSAASLLAEKTGAELVVGYCVTDTDGHYNVEILETISPAEGASTQVIADALERLIRKQPDQWLWMYKRWRTMAPGANPQAYPFYADKPRTAQK